MSAVDNKAELTITGVGAFVGHPERLTAALDTRKRLEAAARAVPQPSYGDLVDRITDAVDDGSLTGESLSRMAHEQAASADAQKLQAQALRIARQRLDGAVIGAARQDTPEIVARMAKLVADAVKAVPAAAKVVPSDLDDGTAFRSPPAVQESWRALSDAARVVTTAISIRSGMMARWDSAQNTAVTMDPWRWILVANASEIDYPDRLETMTAEHRLIALHRAGAVFSLATSQEAAQRYQKAQDKAKAAQVEATAPDRRRGYVPIR